VVESERFTATYDQVIFACHSDQALRLLTDATSKEKTILSAIPYSRNAVVLHTDISLLPQNRKCWSSWNVAMDGKHMAQPTLTYNMNILQGIESEDTFCVTLNQTDAIDPASILGEYEYDHPVFTKEGLLAQQRWYEINGVCNTWFCGAYWRNGFHEDGVWSALRVAGEIGKLAADQPEVSELAMAG
jgi:predicted NAD/FAD-binding protein